MASSLTRWEGTLWRQTVLAWITRKRGVNATAIAVLREPVSQEALGLTDIVTGGNASRIIAMSVLKGLHGVNCSMLTGNVPAAAALIRCANRTPAFFSCSRTIGAAALKYASDSRSFSITRWPSGFVYPFV